MWKTKIAHEKEKLFFESFFFVVLLFGKITQHTKTKIQIQNIKQNEKRKII